MCYSLYRKMKEKMSKIINVLYRAKKNIMDPGRLVFKICNYDHYQFAPFFSDKLYIKAYYKRFMGKKLTSKQLKHPQTFNEKINWLKLYDRNPIYTVMADKVTAKNYIAKKIGSEYIIPTIGVYDSVDKVPFDDLPKQYVIKCNHDGGSTFICKNKNTFDVEKVKKELEIKLKRNYFWASREWQYKNIKPCILVEQYLYDQNGNPPSDYKFFCFNGKARFIEVVIDRFGNHKEVYFNRNYELAGFGDIHYYSDENIILKKPGQLEKPDYFDEMMAIAEKLSNNIPLVRVDLYYSNNRIYVGELTLRPNGGVGPFSGSGDETMGNCLLLPTKKK